MPDWLRPPMIRSSFWAEEEISCSSIRIIEVPFTRMVRLYGVLMNVKTWKSSFHPEGEVRKSFPLVPRIP